MPTIVGILTCMSGKNNILGLTEYKKAEFYIYEHLKFRAQLSWAWKKFYNLEALLYRRKKKILSGLSSDKYGLC